MAAPSLTLPPARTVAESAAIVLREQIRTGQLKPGAPLRQSEIAEEMGVSITPVREAFAQLERQGLVQRTTHRGVVVFRPSIEDLLHGYEIRGALESLAASQAAAHFDEPDIAALRKILSQMAKTRKDADYVELNANFHTYIEHRGGNPRLAALISTERTATNAYILFLGVKPASARETHHEHLAIIEALERANPEAAAAAVRNHLATRSRQLEERFAAAARTPK